MAQSMTSKVDQMGKLIDLDDQILERGNSSMIVKGLLQIYWKSEIKTYFNRWKILRPFRLGKRNESRKAETYQKVRSKIRFETNKSNLHGFVTKHQSLKYLKMSLQATVCDVDSNRQCFFSKIESQESTHAVEVRGNGTEAILGNIICLSELHIHEIY